MEKINYNIIGVMSGTSLDGVDLVLVKFQTDNIWGFEIIHSETTNYSSDWYNLLKNLVTYPIEKLKIIDEDYTVYLAKIIKNFINKHKIKNIDAVCSHGHTALHQPQNKLTYQIGNKPFLANLISQKVVCDFRVQDVELGGQGAPLVPIGDKLLFSKYDYCLNLGGFANISTEVNKQRIAYDVCPVNIVLNHYVTKLGLSYDDGGKIASKGFVNLELLTQLNDLPFYKQSFPKSLGLEWVQTYILPLIDSFYLEVKDVLRTFIEHVSIQIAFVINGNAKETVLVTGGGAYNIYLIERIKLHLKQIIVIPENEIIEYKEALIFALLGVLKLKEQVNCLKSVTGAKKDHSCGKIYLP